MISNRNAILDYYRKQSPISDPGRLAELYRDLPDTPDELAAVVQGLLMHKQGVGYYNLTLNSIQRSEAQLRTVEQRLVRMREIDPSPLAAAREPQFRQIGVCRDFALLHVSMLRHREIPARMRVGFAKYLDPQGPMHIDHWIVEYWDPGEERWILTDPQIDPVFREQMGIETDNTRLVYGQDFYLAGQAWQLARAGQARPGFFRFNGKWKGMPCIRGNMLHDFQAVNRLELTVFDYWDDLSLKSETNLTVEDKALLDQIAALTVDVDGRFDELVGLFDDLPRTRQIRSRLQLLGILAPPGGQEHVALAPSGAEQLAARSNGALAAVREVSSQDVAAGEVAPYDIPPDSPLALLQQQALQPPPGAGDIIVRGARQHNLKHIDVHIPRNRLVVVTGVSGSGKSSLAFDTIYAEGQRRYVESLSSYARQFMGQMEKPQVDQITGLSPSIAIEQKTISRNPRSTVGTVTEILDYLRVLYARVGTPHCPQCGRAVQSQSAQQITDQLQRLPAGARFQLLAPIVRNRKGAQSHTLRKARADGFTRARVDGQVVDLAEAIPTLDKKKKHHIELITDRLQVPEIGDREARAAFAVRLMDSVETTLKAGGGVLMVDLGDEMITLSEHHACPDCELSFPALQPFLFSFNSPHGMCEECNGLGVKLQVDPGLIITQPELSLMDGASAWHGNLRKKGGTRWAVKSLNQVAEHYEVDLETPWNELPETFKQVYLYGSGGEKIRIQYQAADGSWSGESNRESRGAIFHINRLFRQTKSEGSRRYYMQFMSRLPCPVCAGERLCPEARYVTVDEKRLPELTSWSIRALYEWVAALPERLSPEERQIGEELVEEIRQRLGFIRNVGLHYLTLDRSAPTLSGGEGQRIRLASQIGSGLVGVLYILDEPSIGLHTRDHRALLDTLTRLRDIGNTVLVVEHDADTMRSADWIIDLGPGPGVLGGELVAAGSPDDIMKNADSLTGQYLSGQRAVVAPNGSTRRSPENWLVLKSPRLHNLKGMDVRFPLGTLVGVTGVSGSGKSSLIGQTLYPALARQLHRAQTAPGPNNGFEGIDAVDKVINITQAPIGRNPRSNPGTYVGVLTEIRKVFAGLPEAKALGFKPGRFSFNQKGGRCEACAGYGFKKVEMHFLADVWVRCATCGSKRFNRQTLAITYKGRNIADVLDMDIQEALVFFENHPKIRRILQTLHDVGLDYIKLGQSALTLSGGEAQRVKLAKELSRAATGRTLYILDEPTTGLHFADIQRLLDVLHRLVDAGNTVIVIEHNLDVVRSADWLIDLGPEGGEEGGYVVAEGTPEDLAVLPQSETGKVLREALDRVREVSAAS
jgi:excinuclease ABC subunit A